MLQWLDRQRQGEVTLTKFLRRPEVGWEDLVNHCPALRGVPEEVAEQVVFDVKYAGYVARQQQDVARQQRLADKRIPAEFDYQALAQLRHEAREKLTKIRPASLDQASRISGITPADVALLLAHLEGRRKS